MEENDIAPPLNLVPQMWAAAGRILRSSADDVVNVVRDYFKPGQLSRPAATRFREVYSAAIPGIADRVYTSDLLDVEVGELDKLPDPNGNLHDEVVVAYASGDADSGYQVNVEVLDYTLATVDFLVPTGRVKAHAAQRIDPFNRPNTWKTGLQDNIIGTAVGDFDGDGVDEIAVAYAQNQTTLWVSMFRYTKDGTGNRALVEVSARSVTTTVPAPQAIAGSVSLEAGDVDGSSAGTDELLLGFVETTGSLTNGGQFQGVAWVITFDAALTAQQVKSSAVFSEYWQPANIWFPRMQLEPGLFKFDPATGYTLNRRQLAVAFNWPREGNTLAIKAYTVETDLSLTPLWGPSTPLYARLPYTGDRFAIAAGGFRGVKDAANPVWGLAFQGFAFSGTRPDPFRAYGMIDGATGASTDYRQDDLRSPVPANDPLRLPLVAADFDGDALTLGAPVHVIVHDNISTDFILQEPPKHSYYDNNPHSDTYGEIVTVSRRDEFNVSLADSQSNTFESQSTDTVATTIGQTKEISAGLTVKAGLDFGIGKVEAKLDADFKYKSQWSIASTQSLEQVEAADVFLTNDSLAAVDARSGQLRSEAAQVAVDQLTRLRLTLHSDLEQREFNDVLIYDGDPEAGGVLLAYKRRVRATTPTSSR